MQYMVLIALLSNEGSEESLHMRKPTKAVAAYIHTVYMAMMIQR